MGPQERLLLFRTTQKTNWISSYQCLGHYHNKALVFNIRTRRLTVLKSIQLRITIESLFIIKSYTVQIPNKWGIQNMFCFLTNWQQMDGQNLKLRIYHSLYFVCVNYCWTPNAYVQSSQCGTKYICDIFIHEFEITIF